MSRSPDSLRNAAIFAAAVAITLVGGLVYGRLTQRWGAPRDLASAGERVAEMPRQIGPWRMTEEHPIADEILEILQCAGHVNRVYRNDANGQVVSVAMIVGPPGPTAVHTPEICYSSRSFTVKEQPRRILSQGGNSFWKQMFESKNVGGELQEVCYAWNGGSGWVASHSPRFEFGGAPLLYKIQIAGMVSAGNQGETIGPAQTFVEALLNSSWSVKTSPEPMP